MADFKTLATYNDYITANLMLQRLEARGVTSYLADENTIMMQWTLSNAVGGIKLRVLESDFERAKAIIDERAEAIEVEYEIESHSPRCPACGSNNTVAEKYSGPILGLSWLLLGFPIRAAVNRNLRCFYCGNEWKE